MNATRNLVAALAAATLVLASCGDDSAGGTGATTPATVPATDAPVDTDAPFVENPTVTGTDPGVTTVPAGTTVDSLPPSLWTEPDDAGSDASAPPPIVLHRGDTTLTLTAFTYCWTSQTEGSIGLCSDGIPPDPLPVLDAAGPVTIEFPAELDFTFSGTASYESAPDVVIDLQVSGTDGRYTMDLPDELPATVDLFGFGPAGDVFVVFVVA